MTHRTPSETDLSSQCRTTESFSTYQILKHRRTNHWISYRSGSDWSEFLFWTKFSNIAEKKSEFVNKFSTGSTKSEYKTTISTQTWRIKWFHMIFIRSDQSWRWRTSVRSRRRRRQGIQSRSRGVLLRGFSSLLSLELQTFLPFFNILGDKRADRSNRCTLFWFQHFYQEII